MKKTTGLLTLIAAFLAFTPCASADIWWTFNNVNFDLASWSPNGTVYTPVATLTGSFSTNNAVSAVTNFSQLKITAAQPEYNAFAFSIAGVVDDYLPGTIGIYSADWNNYIDLDLSNPLTSSGGSFSFAAGYDCPGCAVLQPDSGARVAAGALISSQNIVTVSPEPALYAVLAAGLTGLVFAIRRKKAGSED